MCAGNEEQKGQINATKLHAGENSTISIRSTIKLKYKQMFGLFKTIDGYLTEFCYSKPENSINKLLFTIVPKLSDGVSDSYGC